MENTQSAKRTRNRIPTACSICRMRKFKCDKKRPSCTSCIKHKTEKFCTYVQTPWESTENPALKEALNYISKLQAELVKSQNDCILLKSINSVQHQNPSLNIDSTMNSSLIPKIEPNTNSNFNLNSYGNSDTIENSNTLDESFINMMDKFQSLSVKHNHMVYYGPTSWGALMKNDPLCYDIKQMIVNAKNSTKTDAKLRRCKDLGNCKNKIKINQLKNSSITSFDPLGLVSKATLDSFSYSPYLTDENKLIFDLLPPIDVCNYLIKHYFKKMYLVHPVIDQIQFLEAYQQTIDRLPQIKSNLSKFSKSDFSFISLLLLILRISRLSLPYHWTYSDFSSNKKEDDQLDDVLGPRLIEGAKLLLSKVNFMRKPNLTIIQCLLMLRVLMILDPTDGDGGDGSDGAVLFGLLSQEILAAGLHRDPTVFGITDNREILFKRRIWYFVRFLDSLHASTLGRMPVLDDDYYDTKLPDLNEMLCTMVYSQDATKNNSNTDINTNHNVNYKQEYSKHPIYSSPLYTPTSVELETGTFENLKLHFALDCVLRQVVRSCCNLKHPVPYSQLIENLNILQEFLDENVKNLDEIKKCIEAKDHPILQVKGVIHFNARALIVRLLISLCFGIFLAFDKSGYTEQRDKFESMCVKLVQELSILVVFGINGSAESTSSSFTGVEWVLRAFALRCAHFTGFIPPSIAMREKQQIDNNLSTNRMKSELKIKSLLESSEEVVSACHLISDKYYSAFRVSQVFSKVLQEIRRRIYGDVKDESFKITTSDKSVATTNNILNPSNAVFGSNSDTINNNLQSNVDTINTNLQSNDNFLSSFFSQEMINPNETTANTIDDSNTNFLNNFNTFENKNFPDVINETTENFLPTDPLPMFPGESFAYYAFQNDPDFSSMLEPIAFQEDNTLNDSKEFQ